jgi:hypothetical protein
MVYDSTRTNLHIAFPNCYLVGKIEQLNGRRDILLNLYDRKPYLRCQVPSGVFKNDILFSGHKFETISKSGQTSTWWHFRLDDNANQGEVQGG